MTRSGTRRSSAEVRELLLKAARRLFARRGYDGTSLRDIAEEAQVDLSVLYRAIGSKDEIFKQAVLDPYHQFTATFLTGWRDGSNLSNQELIGRFTSGLYEFLDTNRDLMLALVAANAFSSTQVHPPAGSMLSEQLEEISALATQEADWRGFGDIDIPVAVRCVVGLVMSTVLLDDWLFPADARRPSPERVVRELQRFGLGGLEHRPE